MNFIHNNIRPAQLLLDHADLFLSETLPGPILDLACGDCSNGIFLAHKGLQVTCCDRSRRSLDQARRLAGASGISIQAKQVDLEQEGVNPLATDVWGAILVFRYLHRPLMPWIKSALRASGLLMYETFTVEQPRFGKPRNPDFLLNPGELLQLFEDWQVIHFFEGIKENPRRAVAQLLCRKPGTGSKQRAAGSRQQAAGSRGYSDEKHLWGVWSRSLRGTQSRKRVPGFAAPSFIVMGSLCR